jgi:hypothetical protein
VQIPIPATLFFVAFGTMVVYFLYRFIKYGGLRGALYGSAIARTVGEVELDRSTSMTTTLRVHVLEDGRIILEVSSRATLAATMHGYPMSADNTAQLIALLQQARA